MLPESPVIMEYLEERYPEPPLLPADPAERALARLLVFRFDDYLGDPYYDLYFERPAGSAERLDAALAALDARLAASPFLAGATYGLADIAYVPWIFRGRDAPAVRPLAVPVALARGASGSLERPADRGRAGRRRAPCSGR